MHTGSFYINIVQSHFPLEPVRILQALKRKKGKKKERCISEHVTEECMVNNALVGLWFLSLSLSTSLTFSTSESV